MSIKNHPKALLVIAGAAACFTAHADTFANAGYVTGISLSCNSSSAAFPIPAGFSGQIYVHGAGGDNFVVFNVMSDGAGTIVSKAIVAQNQMAYTDIVKSSNGRWQIANCNGSLPAQTGNIHVMLVGSTL